MLIVGIVYIAFGKSVIQQDKSESQDLASPTADGVSRLILGVQVRPIDPLKPVLNLMMPRSA